MSLLTEAPGTHEKAAATAALGAALDEPGVLVDGDVVTLVEVKKKKKKKKSKEKNDEEKESPKKPKAKKDKKKKKGD